MIPIQNSKTVLLIDDDMDEQQFVVDAFAEVCPGYRVVCFDDGPHGLLYLQALPKKDLPCLIVLDYDMPLMTGADVLAQLQQMPRLRDIPVVIHSDSAICHLGRLSGAKALLKKAGNWNAMKENVNAFLYHQQELVVL